MRLKVEHYELFAIALGTTEASQSRRDEFAHHIWGTNDAIPNALVLADPKDLSQEMSFMMGPVIRGGGSGRAPLYEHGVPWDSSKYYVYREKDFLDSLAEAERSARVFHALYGMSLINKPVFNKQEFDSKCDELKSDPLIQQSLERKSKNK
jgi:hypothetical protein